MTTGEALSTLGGPSPRAREERGSPRAGAGPAAGSPPPPPPFPPAPAPPHRSWLLAGGAVVALFVFNLLRLHGGAAPLRRGDADGDGDDDAAAVRRIVLGHLKAPLAPNADDDGAAGGVDGGFWLTRRDVPNMIDFYAASWMMDARHFLEVDASEAGVPQYEGAAFSAMRGREHLLRQPLDYLDWAVEHLSTWWRVAGAPSNLASHRFATSALSRYVERLRRGRKASRLPLPQEEPLLGRAVAVVAFSQVRTDKGRGAEPKRRRWEDRDRDLAVLSLAATVSSLVRIGVGRVVVVGSHPEDPGFVSEAFRLVTGDGGAGGPAKAGEEEEEEQRRGEESSGEDAPAARAGGTALAFALAPPDLARSARRSNNVPRAALAGLQLALRGDRGPEWTARWLGRGGGGGGGDPAGRRQYWKYVYYTEADSPLHARMSSLPRVRRALDSGLVLVPHRLQLIPYEGDIPDFALHLRPENSTHRLVPADFKTPILLQGDDDGASWQGAGGEPAAAGGEKNGSAARPRPAYRHCCDAQTGDDKPGTAGLKIRTLWWRQGWARGRPGAAGNHSRLEPYDFVRLSGGTGITAVAGTNQGRRCIPSASPCVRRARGRRPAGAGRVKDLP